MSNNQEEQSKELYELCKKIIEHPLHDVEQCLILHRSKEEFRKEIDLDIKTGLNAYGSELNIYDTQDGYRLEDCYRLLLNNHNYLVTPTKINAPSNKVELLFKTTKKKLKAFDRIFALLDKNAKKNVETDIGLQEVIDNYNFTWLFYKMNKSSFTRSPIKFDCRKEEICFLLLDSYLGIEDREELRKWNVVDIPTLILIILGALPEYGKSPKSYSLEDSFNAMLDLMQKYYNQRGHSTESITIQNISEQKQKGDYPLSKFLLISSLKEIIDEIWTEVSPSAQTELNDSMLYEQQRFCNTYNIQGVWQDDRSCYWNIRETGDYFLLYRLSFANRMVDYTKYTLITSINGESTAIFNIREASNVMNLFRGEKIDTTKIDELDVKLHISDVNKDNKKKHVDSIILKSKKFPNNLFKFKELKRVDNRTHLEIKRRWETLEHQTSADYTFFRSLIAITSKHLYVGSYERDERGDNIYFYKLSKEKVCDLLGDSLYYVDFNQSVGVYKAYWSYSNITKYYLSIDSKAIYIDTDEIRKGEVSGIEITDENETKVIQQFIEIDGDNENKLTMQELEYYSSPFCYMENI
jgi:hypothetical protein